MKKVIVMLLALVMLFSFAACATETDVPTDEPGKVDPPVNTGDTEVVDFSKNVNVNRASEAAKLTIELPIDGIGAGVTTDLKANREMTIAVIVTDTTNPYMHGMWKGGEKAGRDMGVNIVTLAPTGVGSVEEQLQIMEAQIQAGVDAIVLHAIDSAGIQPGVDAANEAGIPVVCVGTASHTGAMMRTGVDYYDTGYIVTKYLCEMAGGEGGVIFLEGPAGAQNAEERKAGALAALDEFPGCELIASQTANFVRMEGMQVMENLLQREGVKEGLKIVVAANDEMAIGAIQAIKAANIEGVLVGGFDGAEDASKALRDGDLMVTYNTDPFGSTYFSVAALVEFLNDGKAPEEYFIPFPSERHKPLITPENVEDYEARLAWYK